MSRGLEGNKEGMGGKKEADEVSSGLFIALGAHLKLKILDSWYLGHFPIADWVRCRESNS